MKVITPEQMAQIEGQAYQEGSSEDEFMEEAGSGVSLEVHEFAEIYNFDRHVVLLCGKGNNAGDAYVAGINLLRLDYFVHAYQIVPLNQCSRLCQIKAERFAQNGGKITELVRTEELEFPLDGIIIDGIFGTGFKGDLEDPFLTVIQKANMSGLPIISIDIPSGLNGETGIANQIAIEATETIFLGLPKLGFFLNQGWNYVGKLRYVDFGLPIEFLESTQAELIMSTADLIVGDLPKIVRNRNKYEAGYVVGLTGSPGMPGAAILSSISALRSGAGIVRILHPDGMQGELSASPYEIIRTAYRPNGDDEILSHINRASAAYVGPGLGRSPETKALLKAILPKIQVPCVLDADALNIIAEEAIALPERVILTPHMGEMHRLLRLSNKQPISKEFLRVCQNYAEEMHATLILKGGPTFIFQTNEPIYVNPTGNPGMATAGTGDVLTGLIAGLLAQGLSQHQAAVLGTYIHGIAGEQAAEEKTPYCMIASDLLDNFPISFSFLLETL